MILAHVEAAKNTSIAVVQTNSKNKKIKINRRVV